MATRERSECLSIPLSVIKRYTAELAPPPPSGTPGQFGLADPDLIRRILDSAGFTGIEVDNLLETLPIGGGLGLDDAVKWTLDVQFRLTLSAVAKDVRPQIEQALRDTLRTFLTNAGVVMESASWLVTARAP